MIEDEVRDDTLCMIVVLKPGTVLGTQLPQKYLLNELRMEESTGQIWSTVCVI
jgi:hypothetical protein